MTTDVLVDRAQNTTGGSASRSQQRERRQHVSEFGSTFPVLRPLRRSYPDQMENSPSRMHKTLPSRPEATDSARSRRPTSAWRNAAHSSPMESGADPSHILVSRPPPMYGYTPLGWDKQLDIPAAAELVLMCGEQIRSRGLTLPLIFSSMALDLSSNRVTALIQAYMAKPREFYVSETRFANPHDLAAVIKWALARLSRVFPVPIPTPKGRKNSDQQEEAILIHQRGFIELDAYATWSAYEKRANYPLAAFSTFLEGLASSSAALLVALFSLLSSTTAYSLQNGMTASRLSRLFGILVFGAPEDETFDKTYDAYLKASNATEHLLLAYVRDMSTMEPLPTRLAELVKGYPYMLATELCKPGKGVRGIPCTTINRQVRLYSSDLLQHAASLPMQSSHCLEWDACNTSAGDDGRGPQLSDRYRKLINLRNTRTSAKETSSLRGPGMANSHLRELDGNIVDSFASLADEAWVNFMNEGFTMPDSSKFTFDLRESERKARAEGPKSVQWSQFEQSGFELSDEGLDTVLAFDESIQEEVKRLPEDKAVILTKLRKTNKAIPPFTYDTKPRIINSPSMEGNDDGQMHSKPYTRVDEVFVEVFADILLGNGWSNRDELTHREANFVVVLFKGLQRASGHSSEVDVFMTESSLTYCFVIEEIVPAQYRGELEAYGRKKNRSRASIRNVTRMIRRKENLTTSDAFLDDVFRRSANGPIKLNAAKQQSTSTLALIEKAETSQDVSLRATTSTNSIDKLNTSGQSTSGKLLALLKNRASRRLRKKSSKYDEAQGTDDIPPPPPPKGIGRSATRSSWNSIDFEARSLHDSEGDAVILNADDEIAAQVQKSAAKGAAGDNAWLDITVRNERPAQDRNAALRTQKSPASEIERDITQQDVASVLSVKYSEKRSMSTRTGDVRETSEEGRENAAIDAIGWSREDLAVGGRTEKLPRPQHLTHAIERKPIATEDRNDNVNGKQALTEKQSPMRSEDDTSLHKDNHQRHDVTSSATPLSPEHLRSLPDRSTSTLKEREDAREARIEAAKERARQLRAKLDADGLDELKRKQDRRAHAKSDGDTSTSSHNGEGIALLSSTKEKSSGSSLPSVTSTRSGTEPKKDDPFAKDRFSGRVANLTNKFGGVVPKPSPSHSPDVEAVENKSTQMSRTATTMSNATKVLSALSTQIDLQGFREDQHVVQKARKSDTARNETRKHKDDDVNDDRASPQATLHRPTQTHDLDGSTNEGDTVYPEAADSGISHNTKQPAVSSKPMSQIGSAAINSDQTFFRPRARSDIDVLPSKADIGTSLQMSTNDPRESTIRLDHIPLEFRQRYQPGMPLSNVEEERESVLSGSNV